MLNILERLLSATAWPMTTPSPYSAFHLLLGALGIGAAAAAARLLSRRNAVKPERVLFFCGLFLACSELYKQLFLYFLVNNKTYNWWYFPFQLCSTPMYLCLIFPFLNHSRRNTAPLRKMTQHAAPEQKPVLSSGTARGICATFLQDFGLLGGFMALSFPEGFLYPYWALTLHGFIWHFLLIFIGLYCFFRGLTDFGEHGFAKIIPLYAAFCLLATFINTAVQLTVYPASYADMFYINCFFPSEQPVFHQISLALGNGWGHLAYLLASCLGPFFIHHILKFFARKSV